MSTRQALERVTKSGIVLPPRSNADAQWPIVQLTTDVQGLTYNLACDHETEEGERAWRELERRITAAQVAQLTVECPMPLELVTPHDGTVYRLTPVGVRHITGVCEAYAQFVDPFATERTGKVVFRKRPEASGISA